MKHLLFLIPIVLLFGCNDKKIKKTPSKNIEDNRFIYTLDYNNLDNSYIKYNKIKIIEKTSYKILQTIDLSNNDVEVPNNVEFFALKDINFDGLNDIELVKNIYAYSTTGLFWIFNKKTKQFVLNNKMNEIENPVIIKEKKEICSKWHDGLDYFTLYKYSWQGDSLIPKEKFEEEWLANGEGHLKISKIVNGKYEVQEKKIKDRFVENMKCE